MRKLILFSLALLVLAGCGGGGNLAAPSGSVIALTPTAKADAPITITSTSTVQKSVVQIYQFSVKESDLPGAKGVRDTIFNVTFELTKVPGSTAADLSSLVTLCDGSQITNSLAEKQTDHEGIYNLCVVFKTGGGLAYDGNLRVLSGAQTASTSLSITSGIPALTLSPSSLTLQPGSRGQITINGGAPQYTLTSSNPSILPVPSVVGSSGGTFIVDVPAGALQTDSPTITVTDSTGASTTVPITIGAIAQLAVSPQAPTVSAGSTVKFMITGGVPDYSVVSVSPSIVAVPDTVTANGGTFSVTIPASFPAGPAYLTVRDSLGSTFPVTITVQAPQSPKLQPASTTVTAGSTVVFTISGGVPAYSVFSSNAAVVPGPVTPLSNGGTFSVPIPSNLVPAGSTSASVTITVLDSIAGSTPATSTITVQPPASLTVLPDGISLTAGNTATFAVVGGVPGYTVVSNNASVHPIPSHLAASGDTFTASVPSAVTGSITMTVIDSIGAQKNATITVNAAPAALLMVPNSQTVVNTADRIIAFTVSGGTPPYTVTSSNPADVYFGTVGVGSMTPISGVPFNVTVRSGAAVGTALLTVTDSTGAQRGASVIIQ
ncbi:MAG: hypothetical protein M0024_02625 [Nitrospiraceae bacterium]|nr:hypothetical protein [Nitrospiraceae bacterium]